MICLRSVTYTIENKCAGPVRKTGTVFGPSARVCDSAMARSAAAVEQQLGESAQRIEILDTSVAELNQKIDRLDERVNTIVATTK
ncbi:hypothetical protein Bca52824_051148 [Brassica carinata]|uniref:Uncharacterized protein n=1 Tax=Brassica carinata TaxID=52824 RepID=A0A8X7R2D3_BRACI|nr:hypothetical protein Bca52824_051148 [Brassica carinata]